ncbi:MAG: rhodanese-like domain-containing protein [Bacteroidales bacterium]
MKLLRRNWLILAILLLVVALVLIRSFSRSSFRYDASRWAAPSADGSNLVSTDKIAGAGDQVLMITLGNTAAVPGESKGTTVLIPPAEILEKENLKLIRKNKGPVLLYSDDGSVTARVWMVLSEMGIRNVYILRDQGAASP